MRAAIRQAAAVLVSTALAHNNNTPSVDSSSLFVELQTEETATEARAAKRPVNAAWQRTTAAFPVSISARLSLPVSRKPRLAAVESLEASVVWMLPIRPMKAGTIISS